MRWPMSRLLANNVEPVQRFLEAYRRRDTHAEQRKIPMRQLRQHSEHVAGAIDTVGRSHRSGRSSIRLACVQRGDYLTARRRLAAGGEDQYQGQRYSIEAFESFVRGFPRLVVSLEAPAYQECEDQARYLGVPSIRLVPRRVFEWLRARRIMAELERFGTTHLVLRCNDLVGCELLKWAIRKNVRVAGILAARFDRAHYFSRRICELGNDTHVCFLANHNRVATASMVDCGLQPEKAVPWDLPQELAPADSPSKTLPANEPLKVMFAGQVCVAKGVKDLITACEMARRDGLDVRLTVCGDGPLLPSIRDSRAARDGWLACPGMLPTNRVQQLMQASAVTVVPSRYEFPEGCPLVIYESLAVRTPLILNDHPIFVRYFEDGVGVRFFHGSNPAELSQRLKEMAEGGDSYARLSQQTLAAWDSLDCPNKFHHILERLAREWGIEPSTTDRAASLAS